MKREITKILAFGMTAFLAISCGFNEKIETLQDQLNEMKKEQEKEALEQNEIQSQQQLDEAEAAKDREKIEALIDDIYGPITENSIIPSDPSKGNQPAVYKGEGTVYSFIQSKLKPVGDPSVMGAAFVRFVIDKEGNVRLPHIMKSLEPAKDQEVKRVCKLLKYTPAKVDGQAVAVYETLRIKFTGDN